MKIDTKYNIGDTVYGVAPDGSTSYGKITFFLTGSKGTEALIEGRGRSCYLDSIGDTENEAFECYCKARYAELNNEINELKQLAKAHNIKLK